MMALRIGADRVGAANGAAATAAYESPADMVLALPADGSGI